MNKRVVVINHWGGVPNALHRNAILDTQTALSDRTMYSICPVPLTRYDAACGFRAAINVDRPDDMCLIPDAIETTTTLFSMFKEAGFTVVVLGASGIDAGRRPTRPGQRYDSEMPDPENSMNHLGVSKCSLFDGAYFRGSAMAHDRAVLREARNILETIKKPILLWLNLLSCRDITCIRFRPQINPPAVDGVLVKLPKTVIDARIKPQSLAPSDDSLYDLRNILNMCDSQSHGEPFHETNVPDHDLDIQYATLLDSAWATLKTLNEEVRLTMQGMDVEIAVTSSHSLSLGECGTRRPGPFSINSNTFWSSTLDLGYSETDARIATLPQILFRFATVCGVCVKVPQPQSDTPVCFGTIGHPNGDIFAARTLVTINDHHYSCIVVWPRDLPSSSGITHLNNFELRAVFDVSTDSEEKYDILAQVNHLSDIIKQKLRRTLPAHAKTQQRESFGEPSITTPAHPLPTSRPPPPTPSPAPPINSTPTSVPPTPVPPTSVPPTPVPPTSVPPTSVPPTPVPPTSVPPISAPPPSSDLPLFASHVTISNKVVPNQAPARPETSRIPVDAPIRHSNVKRNEQMNNKRRR